MNTMPTSIDSAPLLLPCAGVYANLRASGKKADLALVVADEDAVVGGAFTTNVMCAAPVIYCREVMARKNTTRAVSISFTLASMVCM